MLIYVKSTSGDVINLQCDPAETTVLRLKSQIEEFTTTPVQRQLLYHKDELMDDNVPVEFYVGDSDEKVQLKCVFKGQSPDKACPWLLWRLEAPRHSLTVEFGRRAPTQWTSWRMTFNTRSGHVTTIRKLKEVIHQAKGISVDSQTFFFEGRQLANDCLLLETGREDQSPASVLELVCDFDMAIVKVETPLLANRSLQFHFDLFGATVGQLKAQLAQELELDYERLLLESFGESRVLNAENSLFSKSQLLFDFTTGFYKLKALNLVSPNLKAFIIEFNRVGRGRKVWTWNWSGHQPVRTLKFRYLAALGISNHAEQAKLVDLLALETSEGRLLADDDNSLDGVETKLFASLILTEKDVCVKLRTKLDRDAVVEDFSVEDTVGSLRSKIALQLSTPQFLLRNKASQQYLTDDTLTLVECGVFQSSALEIDDSIASNLYLLNEIAGRFALVNLNQDSTTLHQLRIEIFKRTGVSIEDISFTYNGQCLDAEASENNDERTLAQAGIALGSFVQWSVLRRRRPVRVTFQVSLIHVIAVEKVLNSKSSLVELKRVVGQALPETEFEILPMLIAYDSATQQHLPSDGLAIWPDDVSQGSVQIVLRQPRSSTTPTAPLIAQSTASL